MRPAEGAGTTGRAQDHAPGHAEGHLPRFRREGWFEELPPRLDHASVGHAMRRRILSCGPGTPFASVARMMVGNGVHAVVVTGAPDGLEGLGIVTDAELAAAIADGRTDATAGEMARFPAVTAAEDQPLAEAAQLIREAGNRHLVVLDAETREPVGMLSALDLAATAAWGLG